MRARPQRTHYMGQSNRNSSSVIDNNHSKMNNNKTMDILQKSFNKTRSQYYRTTFSNNKINPINRGGSLLYSNNTNKNINDSHCNSIMKQQKGYSSQLNINTIYKNGQKGHHYQFENTKFMNNKKPYLINSNNNNYKINNKNNNNNINIKDKDNLPYEQDQKQPLINPPPINMNTKLNSSITQIKQILMNNIRNKNNNEQNSQQNKKNNSNNSQYPQQEINLYKIKQLKKVFLRNNEKRRNLKEYFQKYVNKQTGKVDKNGFKKLIKQYGYDINDTETKLIFGLNSAVHQTHKNNNNINNNNNNINNINNINNNNNNINNNNYNKNNINNINKININQIDLPQFINLMTKQNIYFQTLKLSSQQQHDKNKQQQSFINKNSFEFTPAEFQIFRNKYPKLKQALKIYKNQPITIEKFQKVMKKLDITDLVLKQQKRLQIFNQFSSKNNNHHGIQQLNVQKLLGVIATQQHQRISNQKQMRLTNHDQFQQNIQVNQQYKFQKFNQNDPLLQLLYPKNLKTSSFVDYQKSVKQARDICQCLKNIKKTKSKDIMKSILQNNQNKLPKQLLYKRVQRILQQQGYNFNTNQYKSFISYIDFDQNNNITKQKLQNFIFKEDQPKRVNRLDRRIRNQDKTQKLLPNGQLFGQKNPQNQFIDKIRAKSTVNWNTMKKTFIKDQNIPQFKVPTKFSAWPQRLYQTDFSLVQAKSSVGMGINEQSRFLKEQKHSFAHQDRLKRLLNYENKVRKVAQWQQINNKRIQQISKAQQKKQQSKLYNMRLLKEEYENRCHSKSFVQ